MKEDNIEIEHIQALRWGNLEYFPDSKLVNIYEDDDDSPIHTGIPLSDLGKYIDEELLGEFTAQVSNSAGTV